MQKSAVRGIVWAFFRPAKRRKTRSSMENPREEERGPGHRVGIFQARKAAETQKQNGKPPRGGKAEVKQNAATIASFCTHELCIVCLISLSETEWIAQRSFVPGS